MPRTNRNQVFQNGVLVSETTRIVSDAEIEAEEAGGQLRQRLAALRVWAGDARTEAELTAMTAAQRLARQAVIETRVAALARGMAYIIRAIGESD